MARHVELGARLLRDAAVFFRNVGGQNPELRAQMHDNAAVYEQVAQLMEDDPFGDLPMEP
ncbi:MAG: hypothetical protein IE933_11495 [Sphingomonadales bacterium]|nr:hypothetical protein [Sphingomonadales bacterium]MBD3773929.1 hypothetical protein [Paracoccaceae bacterium]